jgi:protein TonB
MKRWVIPSTLALTVSFALFVFMANLIKRPSDIQYPPTTVVSDGIMFNERSIKENVKDIRQPPKPMEKSTPPPREVVEVNKIEPAVSDPFKINTDMISMTGISQIGSDDGINTSMFQKPNGAVPDGDAKPIVQVPPLYPPEAARRGIEGWVKLSFSIDQTGSVTNVQVMESEPVRVFDRSAIKALKKWRYKAKFVDGMPVIQDNLQVKLDFTLEGK